MILKTGNKMLQQLNFLLYNSKKQQYLPLLFFRIAAGLVLLLHFLSFRTDINLLFGPENCIFPNDITDLFVDELMLTRQKLFTLSGLSISTFNTVFDSVYILLSVFIQESHRC
jgi:hypothetical protein